MDLAAKHLGFVFAAYGLSLAVLAGLVVWVVARDRRLRAEADAADGRKRP
jgi:heme exporter protein CcmD